MKHTHRLSIFGAALTMLVAPAAFGQAYTLPFQHPVGEVSTFHVSGPATGDSPNPQGDATLNKVEFPNGAQRIEFYKPVDIHDLWYGGSASKFKVRGGTQITVGPQGDHAWADGDAETFRTLMLEAFENNNLNSYVDVSGNGNDFQFTIEFDRVVVDNDSQTDDFGEILYFERGSGNGNSWLKMRAVDENGAGLGPWLVVGPNETTQTTPPTTVYSSSQKMGTTSIDVSRLGVTQVQFLQISNQVDGDPAYTGGGDKAPDFKIMAVMTNNDELARMIFD